MKPLIIVLAIIFIFMGCRKTDIHYIRAKLEKCDVTEQKNVGDGYMIGVGFVKTYYPNGLVKSMKAKTIGAFGDFDSLQFNFTYSGNVAKVGGEKVTFIYHSDGFGGNVYYDHDCGCPPVIYDFEVTFDPKTLYATKAWNTTFNYDNKGRLTGFDDFIVEYDNKGNILRIQTPEGWGTKYKYDYSKKAKQQLYYTSGYMTSQIFNLMEIMGWVPVQPVNLRTTHTIFLGGENGDGLFFGEFYFAEHIVNKDGLLTSYKGSASAGGIIDITPTTNTWTCRSDFKGNMK